MDLLSSSGEADETVELTSRPPHELLGCSVAITFPISGTRR